MEKSQTNATSVTLHPQRQAIWGNIWKHTLKVEQIKPGHETRVTLVSECDISVSKTSRFRNYSNCWDGIGIGFENFWFQKKYRYRFRKKLVLKKVSVSVSKNFGIEKSIGIGFVKFWYRKKYRYRYRKKIGIGKSIGFGIEKIWYRKKVSDSVSFRFWVSSHTAACCTRYSNFFSWLSYV